MRFQVNLAGIIDLLSAHLYSGPEVYLRELLQNGVDALTARASLAGRGDPAEQPASPAPSRGTPQADGAQASWGVRLKAIVVDGARELLVEDDGVGLLPDEMERFLSTIGESSKRDALDEVGLEAARADLLGQFGIGLLSCFMIADEVVVTSRSARRADAPVVRWTGKSDGTYTVEHVDAAHAIGTTVKIAPKRTMLEWVEADRVRDLATHFGSLLPWPVSVDDGAQSSRINPAPAPWQLELGAADKTRALLRFGEGVIGERPLDVIPLRTQAGDVEGAAFVHARARPLSGRHGARVYLKGMLLDENAADLLPDWAFFVTAVVNARALRPTASRESLYADEALEEAREELGDQIRAWLVSLAQHAPAHLDRLVQIHHLAMKQLAAHDDEFLAMILDALPFETTLGYVPFSEIARTAKDGEIRFTSSRDAFRAMAPIARSEGITLANAAYVFESEILERARRVHAQLKLVKVDAADLAQGLVDGGSEHDLLREAAADALAELDVAVAVKKFAPKALPAFYAAGEAANLHRAIERSKEAAATSQTWGGLLDDLDEGVKHETPELVLNADNALVAKLAELARNEPESPLLSTAVRVLYVQALMLGHHPLGPKELAIMNTGLVDLIEAAVASSSSRIA